MDKSKMAKSGTKIKFDLWVDDERSSKLSRPLAVKSQYGCCCGHLGCDCKCEMPMTIDQALGEDEAV